MYGGYRIDNRLIFFGGDGVTNVPLGFMQIVLNLFHNCPEWNDHTSYEQDKTEARHDVTGVCENVISEKTGKIIRKKGDKYDAHHIIEKELVNFYSEVGYGFIKGSEFNINRIMDPYSVRDFRLRVNDFEFYPDIEIYEEFENNKLIFFEGSESALMSIELNENNQSPVYYYDIQIATSLEEFLRKIQENDKYYLELLTEKNVNKANTLIGSIPFKAFFLRGYLVSGRSRGINWRW